MKQTSIPTVESLRQFFCRESFAVFCLLTVAVSFNLINLLPSFLVDVTDGTDIVLHTLLSESVVQSIKDGRNFTDPWQGTMGLGHPLFHYYQHLPHVIVGLSYFLTFGTTSVADILHWSTYALTSVFPLSIYLSARKLGFDRLISCMSGLVTSVIATNAISGYSYSSYLVGVQGLYTQLWAMVLLPLALAFGYQTLREGRGYFSTVLLLSATLMSHLLYGYMAFITLGLLLFVTQIHFKMDINRQAGTNSRVHQRRSRHSRSSRTPKSNFKPLENTESTVYEPSFFGRLRRLFIITILVIFITSFFLVDFALDFRFFNSSPYIDPLLYDSHGASVVLNGLFQGDLFDFKRFPSLTILVCAGLVICLFNWRKPLYLLPVTIFILWLLMFFGRHTWGSLLDVLPLSTDLLMFRFIGGVHLGGIFLMGVALGTVWRKVIAYSNNWYTSIAVILTLAILLPVFIERRSYVNDLTNAAQQCSVLENSEETDVRMAFDELKKLPKGRIYTGKIHYDLGNWGMEYSVGCTLLQTLALTDGLDTVPSLYHRYSLTSDILDEFDETKLEHYNLFNVRYVIAPEEHSFPDFVQRLGTFGQHHIYRVETSGYFDLVDANKTFALNKDNFLPTVASWLGSNRTKNKQHPVISMDSTELEIDYAEADIPLDENRGIIIKEESGNNYYTANVAINRESTIMLKASYHPNWHVTIDGSDENALMLMPGFVGVRITPGDHIVKFEYQPRRLRAILLILGILILPAIVVAERKHEPFSHWFKGKIRTQKPQDKFSDSN